MAGTGKTTFV